MAGPSDSLTVDEASAPSKNGCGGWLALSLFVATYWLVLGLNLDVDCSGEVDAADIGVVIANFGAGGD